MKTTEQVLDEIIDIGLKVKGGIWSSAEKYLAAYIAEVRQDQKEKCAKNINSDTCHIFDQTFFDAVSVQDATNAIMETK